MAGNAIGLGNFLRFPRQAALNGGGAHYVSSFAPVLAFYLMTLAINLFFLWRGISGGIERLAKIAIPALFLFAMVLVVLVVTLGAPDPAHAENPVAAVVWVILVAAWVVIGGAIAWCLYWVLYTEGRRKKGRS